MNNFVKKILTATLAFALQYSGLSAVTYAETNLEEYGIDDYLADELPKYFRAQEIQVNDEVEYSTPIVLYDFSTSEVIGSEILVVNDNDFIGKIEIYTDGECYSSVFDTYLPDEFSDQIINSSDAAFGYYNDNFLFYSSELGYIKVDGVNEFTVPNYVPDVSVNINYDNSVLVNSLITPRSIVTYNLNVTHVSNKTINGVGRCNLACVAMKLNYELGLSLTARDIYEALNTNDDIDSVTTRNAFNYYGYSATNVNGAMTSGDVALKLRDNKPVIMWAKNTAGAKHAMVICGIQLEVTNSIYTADDPNKTSRISFSTSGNPDTVSSGLTDISDCGYSTWYYSWY